MESSRDNLSGNPKDNQSLSGNPKNNQSLSGNPKDNQCLSGNSKNNQSLSGNPKYNQCLSGNPKNNQSLSGNPNSNGHYRDHIRIRGRGGSRVFRSRPNRMSSKRGRGYYYDNSVTHVTHKTNNNISNLSRAPLQQSSKNPGEDKAINAGDDFRKMGCEPCPSLVEAVCSGDNKEVDRIVQESCRKQLNLALVKACETGRKFIVHTLVRNGAEINPKGWGSMTTSLHIAAEKGFLDIADFLISKGANVNAMNEGMETPLLAAINPAGCAHMVELLVAHKAKVHFQNMSGMTAVMKALEAMDIDAVRILLHAGADLGRRNKKRENAKDIAQRLGLGDVLEALRHEVKKHACHGSCDRAVIKAMSENHIKAVKILLDCRYRHNHDKLGTQRMATHDDKIQHDMLLEIFKTMCSESKSGVIDPVKLDIAKMLFDGGAHPDKSAKAGRFVPLVEATKGGLCKLVELLCQQKNLRPNRMSDNYTALMVAARSGDAEILRLLLAHNADPLIVNIYGDSALHLALVNGQMNCATILLESHTTSEADLLFMAEGVAGSGQLECLRLLESYCDLDKISQKLLHKAVGSGSVETVDYVVQKGADVNVASQGEDSAMVNCIKTLKGSCRESMLALLLQRGADTSRGGSYRSALLQAVSSEPLILRMLLDKGADPNEEGDGEGNTPLIAACDKFQAPHTSAVEILLDAGSDPNKTNASGLTALHKATEAGSIQHIRLLVNAGADLESKCPDGSSPLLIAAGHGDPDVIRLLKVCGANLTASDNNGYNGLLRITQVVPTPQFDTLQLLAYDQTQLNVQNCEGHTALMVAAMDQNLTLIQHLLKLEADPHVVKANKDTALSILLDELHRGYGGDDCATELINNNALTSVPKRCNLSFIRMILADRRQMIQLMVTHGMAPLCCDFVSSGVSGMGAFMLGLCNSVGSNLSPLAAALVRGRLAIARYLLTNWFLTPADVPGSGHFDALRQALTQHKPASWAWLEAHMVQPLSLTQLSFVVVSACMGEMIGREERVNNSGLPHILKERLLFRNEVEQMDLEGQSDAHRYGPDDSYDETDYEGDSASSESSDYFFGSEPDLEGFYGDIYGSDYLDFSF